MPKKVKKYPMGGSVDPFSNKNPESIAVKKAQEEFKEEQQQEGATQIEEEEEEQGIPKTNAMDRTKTFAIGGKV